MKISALYLRRSVLLSCLAAVLFAGDGIVRAGAPEVAAAERIISKKLFMAKTEDTTLTSGLVRIPRHYVQGARGEVIIEAEEPSRFLPGDESDPLKMFGQDDQAGAGRYIAYLKRVEYGVAIAKPVKLRLWYHAYFPTIGCWNHTERLDNGTEQFVIDNDAKDANDPTVKKWLWKKGGVYDFSAGSHTFFLDWQGGARLDQLAFLPEGEAPREGELLSATFGTIADKGAALTMPVMLRAGQKLRQLSTKMEPAGGRVEIYLSSDQGKNWAVIPTNGDVSGFAFPDDKQLLFKYVLSAATNHASPLVIPDILTVVAAPGVAPLAKVSKDMLCNEKSISLTPANWSGMRPDETGWKFAQARRPDEKGMIWLDAAAADQIIFEPRQASWIQEDKDSFSGKAVYQGGPYNYNLISFDIAVTGVVKCCPWFRVKRFKSEVEVLGYCYSLPFYCVGYQFDRDEPVTAEYKLGDGLFPITEFQKQEWVWVPGRPVSLKAGPHVFRMRKGLEYALLDRIALVCGEGPAPEGKGAISPKIPVAEGEVVFHALNTVGVQDIAQIKADLEPAGSTIAYAVSTDQGKTFKPLAEAALNKESNPQKGLIIKAVIKGGEKSDQLHIKGFMAELAGAGQAGMELANAEQRILFDSRTGLLTGWWTKKAGWIVPQGYAQSYFGFLMGGAENGFSLMSPDSAELVDIQARTAKGVKTLLLKYALAEGTVSALVRIELPPAGLAQWNLKLVNRSSQDIKSIKFPLITGIRVGNDPEKNGGTSLAFGATDLNPGMPLFIPGGLSGHVIYPGYYFMGWFSLYSDLGSFTAQVRDTDGIGTVIGLEPDPNTIASKMKFDRLLTIGPGEENESHYALGFHEGDWHRSADFYSQWAHSWMDFSRVNRNWAKDVDGLIGGWYFSSGHLATRYITHTVPEMEWLGGSLLDHHFGYGTFFLINPKFGTLAEFRKAHAESAKRGVYFMYYAPFGIFSDLWALNDTIETTPRELLPPEIKTFPPGFGAKWGAKDQSGKLIPSGWFAPLPTVEICPASQGGREFLVEGIASNYCYLTGAHGVYSDTGGYFYECYDTTHEHGKQYGLCAQGQQNNYKESSATARKQNPDCGVICVEGGNDQVLQHAEFAWVNTPLTLYTFPEIKPLGSVRYGVGTREESMRFNHLYSRCNLICYTPGGMNDREFFAHRKRIKDWMYGCRFMDDCGLTASRPGIIAKWFQREDAKHSGALINIQNEFAFEGATVTLCAPLVKDAKFALAYLLDEEEVIKVPCEQDKDGLKIAIPKAKASSILIPARFPEKEAIRAHLVWPQTAGANKLVLFIANMSGKAKTVSLAYTLPEGVVLKDPPANMQVPPLDVKRIEIPMSGLETMAKHGKAEISVQAGSYSTNCVAMVAPPLYNGGFETDSAGRGTADAWRTLGVGLVAHLLGNLTLPFDLNHADGVLDPQNPAEGKFSLRLDGKVPVPCYWGGERQWMLAKEQRAERLKLADKGDWLFNTGQLLILKPGASYQVSFKFRTAADDGVIEVWSAYDIGYGAGKDPSRLKPEFGLFFPTQKVSAQKGDRGWQSHTFQFTAPIDRSGCPLIFQNTSAQPVWIDDVKVVAVDKQ